MSRKESPRPVKSSSRIGKSSMLNKSIKINNLHFLSRKSLQSLQGGLLKILKSKSKKRRNKMIWKTSWTIRSFRMMKRTRKMKKKRKSNGLREPTTDLYTLLKPIQKKNIKNISIQLEIYGKSLQGRKRQLNSKSTINNSSSRKTQL